MPAYQRDLIEGDLQYIAEHMRQDDCREILAQGYPSPYDALSVSAAMSHSVKVLIVNEHPAAAYGVFYMAPTLITPVKNGYIWLLGTDAIDSAKKTFCVLSKHNIEMWLRKAECLIAQVDGRYTKTHRWLEWLKFKPSAPYKMHGVEFINFTLERKSWAQ